MRPDRREAGSTLLEVIVAAGLGTTLTLVFGTTFATSAGLWGRSSVALRVCEEHRRNLDSVANAFRGAALSTLAGFDANGNSTAPTWQCVTGIDANGLMLDETHEISWRADAEKVFGVDRPGELVLVQGAAHAVVARHVPAGGFHATLLGNTLRITLTTFSAGSNHQLSLLTGDTSLTLRN
jgi:hypothetical protein